MPISADGRTVNLLIPLYLVVGAGTLAHLLPRLLQRLRAGGAPRGAAGAAEAGARAALRGGGSPPPATSDGLLLAAVALYALQISYSADRAKAAENLAFFYVPFGLLFVLLRDVRWTPRLLLRVRWSCWSRWPSCSRGSGSSSTPARACS